VKLYRLLVQCFRLVSHLYFAQIHVIGIDRLPQRGPVLLAANHPGSILDSILLATQVPRTVHYLARSGLFRPRPLGTLLRNLGAIPVYRRSEAGDHRARNDEAFERVYELFESGGCVGIFPEGHNSPQGRLGPLRSGAARLALGAEARNGYALGLTLMPAGIVFGAREFLLSAVVLRFAEPIRVADYAALHRSDPEGAVAALTGDLQRALQDAAAQAQDREIEELAGNLAAVFGRELAAASEPAVPDPGAQGRSRSRRWLLTLWDWYRGRATGAALPLDEQVRGHHRIAEVLHRARRHEPDAIADLQKRVARYKDHLAQTELRRAIDAGHFDAPVRERLLRLRMTLYAVAAAPPALFGAVHNVVPYLVTRWLARRFREDAVRAFAYFGIGVVAFALAYAAIALALWHLTALTAPAIALYLLALPPTGLAALSYRGKVVVYRDKILLRTFLWHHNDWAEVLARERRALLADFQGLAARHITEMAQP